VIAGVAAVVVAAVVVLAVLAYEVRTPSSTGSSATTFGTPLKYSQIVGPAETAQASRAGAPWTPDTAVGFSVSQSSTGEGGLVSGCNALWENSSPIVVPATPSGAPTGAVAMWILASVNSSGAVLLTFISDLSGTIVASNAIVVEGSCTSTFTELGAIPTTVVDSTVVATTALGEGGSTFLSEYPGSVEGIELLGDFWEVVYVTCSPFTSSGGTGVILATLFYASNGTFISSVGPETAGC
jgi:hypothetical protein